MWRVTNFYISVSLVNVNTDHLVTSLIKTILVPVQSGRTDIWNVDQVKIWSFAAITENLNQTSTVSLGNIGILEQLISSQN